MTITKATLLFFIFISALAIFVNTTSAAINITDAEALYEADLSSVSIPTNPYPIKTVFTINIDASISQNLSSVSIPTQPSPLKDIFIINEDVTFDKNLYTVSIPTTPSPIKEIFIFNANAALTKNLVPMSFPPTVSISIDKYEYTADETMSINITLANPTEEWQPVYFAWRLDLPDYDLQYGIMTKALYLPPDYEQTFPIPFTLGDYEISFNASWYVALYNTTTLEVLSEDTVDWKYVPGKMAEGEIIPEEIARDVEAKILLEKVFTGHFLLEKEPALRKI